MTYYGTHAEETKKKISKSKINISDETRRKISNIHKGNKYRLNKHHSEETKNKLSELNKGIKHPMFGKQHTIKSKNKMSESHKGVKLSEETKKKISESLKNKRNKLL